MLALVALVLVSPVSGDIARGFEYAGDPFAPGHHRGVDLQARAGEPVRAACGGRVLFAGRAGANGRAVTIRCGRFNVTHLPLETLATSTGATLRQGAPLGTAARTHGHDGLHLGVRRTNEPLGYIDPTPLLQAQPRPAPPVAPRAIARRTAPPPPHPEPLQFAPQPRPQPARAGSSPPLAPWPAWAGLALLLAGAAGGTARAHTTRRRRRAALERAATAAGTVTP